MSSGHLQQLWGPMFHGNRGCQPKPNSNWCHSNGLTSAMNSLNRRCCRDKICLGVEVVAHCDYFFKLRHLKFSYLLTYLHESDIQTITPSCTPRTIMPCMMVVCYLAVVGSIESSELRTTRMHNDSWRN